MVLRYNGSVYLHHHAREGTVGLVGGKKDPIYENGEIVGYESDEVAVCREFREETGCAIRIHSTSERNAELTDNVTDYPVHIVDTIITGKTKVFIADLLGDTPLDLQAWRQNEKETAGIYAVCVEDIINHDGGETMKVVVPCSAKSEPVIERVLPIRKCAIRTLEILKNYFKGCRV